MGQKAEIQVETQAASESLVDALKPKGRIVLEITARAGSRQLGWSDLTRTNGLYSKMRPGLKGKGRPLNAGTVYQCLLWEPPEAMLSNPPFSAGLSNGDSWESVSEP